MQNNSPRICKRITTGRLFTVLLLFILPTIPSCKKFLSSYSQNQVFSKTANDLEELLLGQGYPASPPSFWIHTLDDDIDGNPTTVNSQGSPLYSFQGYHFWQPAPHLNSEGKDVYDDYYMSLYKWISSLNTILYDAPGMLTQGEPADQLQKISGESRFLRALYYFMLVNIYGQPYNAATAGTDYGVPLKTDPAIQDKFFSRASVKQVYDQIVSDLLQSEKELENYNEASNIRVNQAVVQAFLSRVYLYMSEYENAILYSNKVIGKNKYRVIDLNATVQGTFLNKNSTETIFCKPLNNINSQLVARMQSSNFTSFGDNYKVSSDLRSSYAANDLRPAAFFQQSTSGEVMNRKAGSIPNLQEEYILRLPEILLNKAEALAALGRNQEAADALEILRKNRYQSGQTTPISETGAALMNLIRTERRKELCFECQRWFDLRRIAVNAQYPFTKSIRHTAYGFNNGGRYVSGYYELKPYPQDKVAYVIPVPKIEIDFNQGAIRNEDRIERPLIQ